MSATNAATGFVLSAYPITKADIAAVASSVANAHMDI